MTKHYLRPHQKQQQCQEQEQHKERGRHCKEHNTKYLCSICGHENSKQGEVKYYFVSG